MRNAFLKSLMDQAEKNDNLILVTADLGYGVFESFEEKYSSRYINVGIAEQAMIGMAAGLALEGKCVIAYSLGNFPTLRCIEQIRNDLCYHDLNVTIVASGGGFSYGQLGMSHHATEDLAIMRALPNVEVCAPCSVYECAQCLPQLISRNGVSYLRLDKSSAPDFDYKTCFEFGKMRQFRDGQDMTIIATGGILSQALIASDELKKQGVTVRVLACHSLKPFDSDAVQRAAVETGGIVTLEEHTIIGGLASAVSDACISAGILPKAFHKFGLNDMYSSIVGDQQFLRKYYGMDSEKIVKKIIEMKP